MICPEAIPELVATRVRLRALEERDVPGLFEMSADAEAMRYWASPPMTERAQAQALLERSRKHLAERSGLRWAVARVEDDGLLGMVSLFAFDDSNRHAEIGYALDRRHWGRGFMHEALTATIDWAFGSTILHRLEADTDPRNAASLRTLERLGFVREGLLRERWRVAGEISDSAIFGLLRADWVARTR